MPSSLTRGRSCALDFSSCPPVSVSGTVPHSLALDSISRRPDYVRFASAFLPLARNSAPHVVFPARFYTSLFRPELPFSGRISPHASCPRNYKKCRIIHRLPINYAFQPHLRGRLTLGRLPLPRKPRASGGWESHPSFRYSCLHSLFRSLQDPSQASLLQSAECSPTVREHFPRTRGFGVTLSPVTLSAQRCSTSELLRTLLRNGCF